MGICDSNKNQNAIVNNTGQATITSQVQTSVQQPIQNVTSKVEQNVNSNANLINNNVNIINGNVQPNIVEENDRPSNINRSISLGSSVRNEDSIGYNQTRETLAN